MKTNIVWVGGIVLMLFPFSAQAAITTDAAALNGGSAVTVAPGASITASVTAGLTGNNVWHGTWWRISSTDSGSLACVNTPDHNDPATESFGITAPLSAGTYNAYFQVQGGNTCTGASGNLLVLPNAVVVQDDSTEDSFQGGFSSSDSAPGPRLGGHRRGGHVLGAYTDISFGQQQIFSQISALLDQLSSLLRLQLATLQS